MSSSNTIPKQLQGKGFKKGDPRINRKGRPKSFDTFRALALGIADEKVRAACKSLGITPPNEGAENLKVAEFILRKWALSNEPKLQIAFTEVAFGKVPLTLAGENGELLPIGRVIFEIVNAKDKNA